MFSTKNISPRQLSAFTAFVLALPVSLVIGFKEKSWIWGTASFVVLFAGGYLLLIHR
jgi:two-component system phosphate regulon sensor histidine kinase PhoR